MPVNIRLVLGASAVGNCRRSFRRCYVILRDQKHVEKETETRDHDLSFVRVKGRHISSAR